MVFKHNKQSFNVDQFDPLSYGNLRGLETNSQLLSLTEISSSRTAIAKSHIADFEKESIFGNSEESKPGNAVLKDSSASSLGNNFSFSWLTSSSCEAATLDHGKRPLSDVKPCQVACKRPKQMDQSTQLYSLEEHAFSTAVETSPTSALADEFVETREPDDIPVHTGNTTSSVGSDFPCSKCEQFIGEESLYSPAWATSFPSYFEDYEQVATYDEVDDIDSPIHEYLPRKTVAIGPDHQADIPEWRPRVSTNDPSGSGSCADLPLNPQTSSESAATFVDHRDHDNDSGKWISYCVMPMPVSYSDPVASTIDYKMDCGCSDEGSIRCVRQHVMEARENLKRSLGQDKFDELGFCEMGEDVALKWTDEEEKLFQQVVLSNPPSLGKNFWNYLLHAFPDKTIKELVSYYFNVFTLRKRAQQNRSDWMHVDSDDDELPESDEGEPGVIEEEEEDSAVESPTDGCYFNHHESIQDVHEESEGDFDEFSFPGKVMKEESKSRHLSNMRPMETNLENFVEDADIQDESCTSFEGQHSGAHCADRPHMMRNDTPENPGDLHMVYGADGASGIIENGLFDGHCDPKPWDVGFDQGKRDDEFLSTCNVVEEVIRMGTWENSAMGGHDIS